MSVFCLKDKGHEMEVAPVHEGTLRHHCAGDLQLEKEIITLALSEFPRLLKQLEEAGSYAEWKLSIHTLKGTARFLGAWKLAEVTSSLENQNHIFFNPYSRQTGHAKISEDVKRIQKYLHQRLEY